MLFDLKEIDVIACVLTDKIKPQREICGGEGGCWSSGWGWGRPP